MEVPVRINANRCFYFVHSSLDKAAVRNAKDPKTKKRLKAAHTYAEQRKEASKQKTKSRSRGAFTR